MAAPSLLRHKLWTRVHITLSLKYLGANILPGPKESQDLSPVTFESLSCWGGGGHQV